MGSDGSVDVAAQRTLWSYLLLPRPVETPGKLALVPMAFGLAKLGGETGGVSVTAAIAGWLVFELGLCQARYMLNDLADAEVDRAHVGAEGRGRAPDAPGLVPWAVAVVVGRLAVSATAILLLPSPARVIMVAATLGLVAATGAYELARSRIRRHVLADWREARLSAREVAVYSLVGVGYGLRVGLGVALAGAGGPVLASAVAFGWVAGVGSILMVWTVEAVCLQVGDGAAVLSRKSHVAVLALLGDGPGGLDDRPLQHGRPARLAAGVLSGTAASAVALGLSLGDSPGAARILLLLLVSAVVAPLLLAAWPSQRAGAAVLLLFAVAAMMTFAGHDGQLAMLAVATFSTAIIVAFRSASLSSLGFGPEEFSDPSGS